MVVGTSLGIYAYANGMSKANGAGTTAAQSRLPIRLPTAVFLPYSGFLRRSRAKRTESVTRGLRGMPTE